MSEFYEPRELIESELVAVAGGSHPSHVHRSIIESVTVSIGNGNNVAASGGSMVFIGTGNTVDVTLGATIS